MPAKGHKKHCVSAGPYRFSVQKHSEGKPTGTRMKVICTDSEEGRADRVIPLHGKPTPEEVVKALGDALNVVQQELADTNPTETCSSKLENVLDALPNVLEAYKEALKIGKQNKKERAARGFEYGAAQYKNLSDAQRAEMRKNGWSIRKGDEGDIAFMNEVAELAVRAHAEPVWAPLDDTPGQKRSERIPQSKTAKPGKRVHTDVSNMTTVYLVDQDGYDFHTHSGSYKRHKKTLDKFAKPFAPNSLYICTDEDLALLRRFEEWVQRDASAPTTPKEIGLLAGVRQSAEGDQVSHQDSTNLTLSCIIPLQDNTTGTYFAQRAPVLNEEAHLKLEEVSERAWQDWRDNGGESGMKSCGTLNLGDRLYFQGFGIHKAPPATDTVRRAVFAAFEPPCRACDDVVLTLHNYSDVWQLQHKDLGHERRQKSKVLLEVKRRNTFESD